MLVNYICTNFPLSIEDKFQLLKENTLKDRLYSLIQILNRETKLANLKQDIQMRTREDLDKQQREYFLQQQIKNIQDELGRGQEDEIDELRNKGKAKNGKRKLPMSSNVKFRNWNASIRSRPTITSSSLTCKPCWHCRGTYILRTY